MEREESFAQRQSMSTAVYLLAFLAPLVTAHNGRQAILQLLMKPEGSYYCFSFCIFMYYTFRYLCWKWI